MAGGRKVKGVKSKDKIARGRARGSAYGAEPIKDGSRAERRAWAREFGGPVPPADPDVIERARATENADHVLRAGHDYRISTGPCTLSSDDGSSEDRG